MSEYIFNDKKSLLIAGLVLVILVGGYFTLQHFLRPKPSVVPKFLIENYQKTKTPAELKTEAELLKSLPPDFVLDKAAKEYSSDATNTPTGLRLTKVFDSKLTVAQLDKLYQDYFKKADWRLDRRETLSFGVALFFSKGFAELNVTLVKKDSGSAFTLTYYPQRKFDIISPSPTPVAK